MTTAYDRTPVPRIQPRKGFNWLPMEQQLSVFALIGLLILAVLPLLIDSGRAGSGQLKQALSKPRSVSAAFIRLERHYGLAWRTTGSVGEQRLRQKLLALGCGVAVVGALAGWKAQAPVTPTAATTSTTPRIYGDTNAVRACSAVALLEEDRHA
jgi:hypothetical protein